MKVTTPVILTVNCGSSSLKYGLFSQADTPEQLHSGQIRDIGKLPVKDMEAAVDQLIALLNERFSNYEVTAIGHRMVQGGLQHMEPERVSDQLLSSLSKLTSLAPDHLPAELAAIRAFAQVFPQAAQIVCFDTAFHQHMPFVARHYALPRRLWEQGLLRYGFHGLSYEYIMQQLQQTAPETANGRIIIAHLGNGASMAAVHKGRSIDTTMGLTPAGGLVMSTRPGDLDPGVILYLLKEQKMSTDELNELLNKQAGLKAVSGKESDIEDLLDAASEHDHAAEAIDLFCYQARKYTGALAAAMGGLDTFIFTGGIGEHAPEIRQRICEGLEFLGMHIDTIQNEQAAAVISARGSAVVIRVIPTSEEQMIAQHTRQCLQRH
ncbi:MAG TPA: acetate/propionate family kinase [Chitinophaga sp.]